MKKPTKRILSLTMALLLAVAIFPSGVISANQTQIAVVIDGTPVIFQDQAPAIVDGRTLVPVRGVFEEMGFEVDWENDTRTAVLTNDEFEVRITVGSYTFTTNGVEFTLDVPAQIIGGRTMVPIRLPLESVGFVVGWHSPTNRVYIGVEELGLSRDALMTWHFEAIFDYISAVERVDKIRTFAEAGDAAAQWVLAVMYNQGRGVEANTERSLELHRMAAEQGIIRSLIFVGVQYFNAGDLYRAAYNMQLSAEGGYPQAQANMGILYSYGLGVTQDDSRAVYWWRLGAEGGIISSMTSLAYSYENGRGVEQSIDQAIYWLTRAAELGSEFAIERLYELGVEFS